MLACPSADWTNSNDSCYIELEVSDTWNETRLYCESNGADLPSIHSEEENDFLQGNLTVTLCDYVV